MKKRMKISVVGYVLCGGVTVVILLMMILSAAAEEGPTAWPALVLVSGTLLLASVAWGMAFRRRS